MLLRNATIFGIILLVLLFGMWLWSKDAPEAQGQYDEFAKCLASKNVTMYGAEWCPHCQSQKNKFGASFKHVPYVECPNNIKTCTDLGIEAYPTWIFGDGTKFVGDQEMDRLAAQSGCSLE